MEREQTISFLFARCDELRNVISKQAAEIDGLKKSAQESTTQIADLEKKLAKKAATKDASQS